MPAEKEYILGTHDAEIERLGLQHRVWRPRATDAWRRAGFHRGQTLLDVGSGPGYAALDFAEIVGPEGRVHALDRSRRFLDSLSASARIRGLENIEVHELDLDEGPFPDVRADGAWLRWVCSFVRGPERLIRRVAAALKPGGTIALHEYLDYGTWRLSPRSADFEAFVDEVMASWRAGGGEPDVGMDLPRWLDAAGFELLEERPIMEIARPGSHLWEWPKAFVDVGIDRLVDLGRVDATRARAIKQAFLDVEGTAGSFCTNPAVLEVIARKR
jgi:SAM-dependent methyltransferase